MAASRRRASTWCCSFSPPPASPDRKFSIKSPPPTNPNSTAIPSPNPNPNPRPFLSRRILSPGRVSPIDSDPVATELATIVDAVVQDGPDPTSIEENSHFLSEKGCEGLRFEIKEKNGRRGFMVELVDWGVLCENSEFFRGFSENDSRVLEVDNVDSFKETIELMVSNEVDLMRSLMKIGVSRAIDVLEVSHTIKYEKGIASCLKYIEATPWNENEEEKLKLLFSKLKLKDQISQDILSRLTLETQYASLSSGDMSMQLIKQITNSTNNNARKDMQSFLNSLLCKSSVYRKDPTSLDRESLYQICNSCLNSLNGLFKEANSKNETKPLIERVSNQVENLTWLFEILINNNISEEFVEIWGNQEELVKLHESASPLVRYELSRVSACIFVALGKGRMQCKGEVRTKIFNNWFGPILSDFGWLKRCPKGLNLGMLEETLGKALLTLPLVDQQRLFQEWFRSFSMRGTECPNLSRSFQVWWRRAFVKYGH